MGTKTSASRVPIISPALLRWFTAYSRQYIRKHFHALRISNGGADLEQLREASRDLPIVLYSNHPSWWDPLVCLVMVKDVFPERNIFAPMAAAMLERYKMFGKMGFFGVEQGSTRGAVQFLHTAEAILESSQRSSPHLLAMTPQGRFADPREPEVRFQAGLGHLAARVRNALFVPCAIEYVFWNERLPEILVSFGEAIEVRDGVLTDTGLLEHDNNYAIPPNGPNDWTHLFEHALTCTMNDLKEVALRRDPANFTSLLSGETGQGGVYDLWRVIRSFMQRATTVRSSSASNSEGRLA